ncbi:hypothetical protein [Kitasatospora herbaricolor]|uniref:Uncharacterized protein n=1 Tax=Kitasatospora herbaricolor TaxID=68217 RepID=A0ABZ1WIP5_9ACTN|nr:hypothetical protein [Kitasatospora herbaricolor]
MGRKKTGKPRRERAAVEYSLRELRPPGYEEWITVAPGMSPDKAAADPLITPGAVGMMRRLARLRPLYGPQVPVQALWLDLAVDEGELRLRRAGGTVGLPVAELAGLLGAPGGPAEDVRAGLHELHARGVVLVEPDEERTVLRVVTARPARPGGRWLFEEEASPAG